MKLLAMMNVLQLSPLFRRFRQRVEAREIPLEESVKTLSYASELVVQKLRWLLPNTRPEREQAEEAEEIMGGAEDLVSATATAVMERWEVDAAARAVGEEMKGVARTFSRGYSPSYEDGRRLLVVNIDPTAVRDALITTQKRTSPTDRVLLVPRLSFVTHLRDFWREVRRLTASGAILRFSRFLGKTREEAILNFLAFLELIKRRRLYARQKEIFGDIEFSTTQYTVNREDKSEP